MAKGQAETMGNGQRTGAKVVVLPRALEGVREGTTGQLLTVARIWAVAASGEPATAAENAPSRGGKRCEVVAGELRFYRKYTEALLRRYMQMTMEAGRVPSLMGREVLRGKASSYRIHGFDDAVIFRMDVEKCLAKLESMERELLRRVVMQEHTQAEAAPLLGISLRTCVDRYGKSLDKLTGILLQARVLEPFRALSRERRRGE